MTSAGWGIAVGLAYGASSILVAKIALPQESRTFMTLYFGGMFVRIVLALAAVAILVLYLSVDVPVFVASLMSTVVVSIILEVVWLVRHRPPTG